LALFVSGDHATTALMTEGDVKPAFTIVTIICPKKENLRPLGSDIFQGTMSGRSRPNFICCGATDASLSSKIETHVHYTQLR